MPEQPDFSSVIQDQDYSALRRSPISILQINVGKVCNQACQHCHVDAGPKRTESMSRQTAERVLELLSNTPRIATVDITGGAPEINPNFRSLVTESRHRGKHVIDRCNLTILLEPGYEALPSFLAEQQVEITASLPCYTAENVDKQRGRGVFERSIRALQLLNRLGYGKSEGDLRLNLVYNPLDASLPPPQQQLERDYKRQLGRQFGIEFNRLFTITNMPISRFADHLVRLGEQERYLKLLVKNFNPKTLGGLMCRSTVSVGWDGVLYDCDFNQMLGLRLSSGPSIWNIDSFDQLTDLGITTGAHCFGCTAGTGSSCGGQLESAADA